MMVLQKATTETLKMDYVEEPSLRKSLFNKQEEVSAHDNTISKKAAVLLMTMAFACLGVVNVGFKGVYLRERHTVWEDIYGRSVVFFACAVVHYLVRKGDHNGSVFEIKKTIRWQFLFRIVLVSLAYVFLYLSLQQTSSFLYVALILCVLPPLTKLIHRYANLDKHYNLWDTLTILSAIVGLVFLFRGNSHFLNQNKYLGDFAYDNLWAYVFGLLALVLWTAANLLHHRLKSFIHPDIDTFYTAFFLCLTVPALILGYFSMYPAKLTYTGVQFLYFLGSGVLFWVFHALFTRALVGDHRVLAVVYVYLVICWVGDGVIGLQYLEWC